MDKEQKALVMGIAEIAAELVVEIGVSAIVGDAIESVTPSDVKKIGKIFRQIGGIALKGAVGKLASNYVNEKFIELEKLLVTDDNKEEENGSTEAAGPEA